MIPLIPIFQARCDGSIYADVEDKYNAIYRRWGRYDLFECMNINSNTNQELISQIQPQDQVNKVHQLLKERVKSDNDDKFDGLEHHYRAPDEIIFCDSSTSLDKLLMTSIDKLKELKVPNAGLNRMRFKRHRIRNEWNEAMRDISTKIDYIMSFIKIENVYRNEGDSELIPISWSMYLCGVDKYNSGIIHIYGPIEVCTRQD